MCDTLGLLLEPSENKVPVTEGFLNDIQSITMAFSELNAQKTLLGSVNHDIWLEFIPWHSLN